MKVAHLLTEDRIRIPLASGTVHEGFAELLALLPLGTEGEARASIGELGTGEASVSGRTRVLTLSGLGGADPLLALGVAPHPLESAPSEGEGPRVLVLAVGKTAGADFRSRLLTGFGRPEIERDIMNAPDASAVLTFGSVADLEVGRPLKVEDVMVPLSYRVYPETPVSEVLDLIARRRLQAVPVVDEGLQVLGVISAADALQHALRRRGKGAGRTEEAGPTARQIMTRSVLCVAEDQALLDAAQLMANRDAAQLPVVREGEIIGFLTRDGVLFALFGGEGSRSSTNEPSNEASKDSPHESSGEKTT